MTTERDLAETPEEPLDPRVVRVLRHRAGHPVPPGLHDDIMAEAELAADSRERPRAVRLRGGLLLAATVSLVAVLGAGALAMGGGLPTLVSWLAPPSEAPATPVPVPGPTISASTEASPPVTASPDPVESPGASPTVAPTTTPPGEARPHVQPRGLVPDAIVEVLVDSLRVRSEPTVDDAVSRKIEPLLDQEVSLFIVDGPVSADGYDWYEVSVLGWGLFGWVAAASREGEPWIEDRLATECPVFPDDAWRTGAIAEEVIIHCFGDAELEFELDTSLYCFDPERPGTYEPEWLLGAECGSLWGDACGSCGLPLAAPPGVHGPADELDGARTRTGIWRFVGRFDDPDARSCRAIDPGEWESGMPPSEDEIVHWCRTRFVLSELAWIGESERN